MNSGKSWPEWSFHFPTHLQPWQKDKEPSESKCKTILKKPLLNLGNGTHCSQTSLSLVEMPLWTQAPVMSDFLVESTPQSRVD